MLNKYLFFVTELSQKGLMKFLNNIHYSVVFSTLAILASFYMLPLNNVMYFFTEFSLK